MVMAIVTARLTVQLGDPDSARLKLGTSEMESPLEEELSTLGLQPSIHPYFPANPKFKPRKYQLEVYEKAREQNTIIVMETGCGKTMIAVMLIYDLADRIRKPANKIAVFLAPTVPLVQQQADVIESSTSFRTGRYWGGVADDTWNRQYWEEEVKRNEVFVMTPELLVTGLRHRFLRMDMVEILIFDECHHTLKKTPYAAIMNEFYLDQPGKLPRIFGMTAVPIIGKGSTKSGCAAKIDDLEALLHAKVYTIRDKTELEHVNPSPIQSHRYYDSPYLAENVEVLQARFAKLKQQYLKDLIAEEALGGDEAGDLKANIKQHKKLRRLFATLDYCLLELGLWCTQKAAELLDTDDPEFVDDAQLEYEGKKAFLRDIKILLKTARPKEDNALDISQKEFSTKVLALLDLLKEYRNADDLKCIVFVERVIAARVLAELLSRLCDFSFLRCKFLAGSHSDAQSMSRQHQKALVEEFRGGKVNLIVATNIAEEGLDIQTCGLVIRFDLPPTLRSFIQSRGRARRIGSSYVLLVERGNAEAESCIQSLLLSESMVAEEACGREEMPRIRPYSKVSDVETFQVQSTGASVNTDCSVQLLHRYCSTLPGDKFYAPAPEFNYSACPEGGVTCSATLPPNAPFRHVVGHPCHSNVRAKQVACLEACRQLHACGALTDYLLFPDDLEDEEETHFHSPRKNVAAPKAAGFYPRVIPSGLSGASVANGFPARLHVYRICLAPEPFDREYAEFALFLEAALDNELASVEVRLNLSGGRAVTAKLIPAGQMDLDQCQVHDAKLFQTYLLSTILDPNGCEMAPFDVRGRSISMMDAWDPSLSYLVLPLISTTQLDSVMQSGDIEIDWLAVRKVISTKGLSSHGLRESNGPVYEEMSCESAAEGEALQVADGLASVEDVVDAMVLVQHGDHRTFYRVPEVLYGQNSNSSFNDPIAYATYAEYFQGRHGETIVHSQQPLLRAKPLRTVHNLLAMRATGDSAVASKLERMVELPPELCKLRMLGCTGPIVDAVSLLPSFLHRLESMLIAIELRDRLAAWIPEAAKISAMKMLAALTTGKCGEAFSLESLELLGDAFLKFAVSLQLFLVYDKKHEGQLSVRRSRAICNHTLHKLGESCGLPGFIRDSIFCPKQWVAPGRWCRFVCDSNRVTELHNLQKESERNWPELQCSQGHRLIYHKTVADVVEALIGTHLVECGQDGALAFMKWVGVAVDFDPVMKVQAQKRREPNAAHLNGLVVRLENNLNYRFRSKALAIEAVTHASYHDPLGQCYQRLEFLGDAVLDFLITKHLYFTFPGLKPGLLTDLRSATVNNDAFARVAVQHCLHSCLLHNSKLLMDQVKEFVSLLKLDSSDTDVCHGWEGDKAPKVLGDMVESLAGAVFVDANFDVDRVWSVFEPLLQPFATLDTLRIHPVRELYELCQLQGFKLEYDSTMVGKHVLIKATVDAKNFVLTGQAEKMDSKSAKRVAAQDVLIQLQSLGYKHPRQLLLEALDPERNFDRKTGSGTASPLVALSINEEHKDRRLTEGLNTRGVPSQGEIDQNRSINWVQRTHDAGVINPEDDTFRSLHMKCSVGSTPNFPSQPDPDLTCIRRRSGTYGIHSASCEQSKSTSPPRQHPLGSTPEYECDKQPAVQGNGFNLKSESVALKIHEVQLRVQNGSSEEQKYVAPLARIVYDDTISVSCNTASQSATDGETVTRILERTSMFDAFREHCIPSKNTSRRFQGSSTATSSRAESSQQVILESSVYEHVETTGHNSLPKLQSENRQPRSLSGEDFVEAISPAEFAPILKMLSQLHGKKGKRPSTEDRPDWSGRSKVPTDWTACTPPLDGQQFFRSTIAREGVQCGEHRAKLYELCAKKKWPSPQFLWSNPHLEGGLVKYQCDAQVEIPSRQVINCAGDQFCNKRAAMDSAASVALEWLTQQGFL